MSTVANIGVPDNYATPGDFLQINFGVGPGGGDVSVYGILVVANRTTAGAGVVDTTVYGPNTSPAIQTETDVIALAGTGSEAHRMWLRLRSVLDKSQTVGVTAPPVYMIFPTESVGAQASLDFALLNVSTGAAVLRFYCQDEWCDTQIANLQVVDSIGAALAQSINNMTRWPITATYNSSTDTLTVLSRNHGLRANEIRVSAKIVSGSTATTIANNVSTPLAGGTTADSWTTALATILPTRYYYICSPDTSVSGTTFDDLVTQVLTQANPLLGIRQVVVSACIGTQGAGSTIAATPAINTERAELAWLQTPELTAGELAAKTAGVLSVFESLDWAYNFRNFGKGTIRGIRTQDFWNVPAPQTQANWPTPTSIETALNNGLMPIGITTSGQTYMTWSICTRHKNGSNFDYRARSSHLRSVLDRWCDELLAEYDARFGGSTIIDDLGPGDPVPGPRTVQPQQILALIFEKIDKYANKQIKNAKAIKAATIVQRDPAVQSRTGARIPMRVIDLLLQNLVEVDDQSTAPA